MPNTYRTSNMEQAVRSLAGRHRHVLLYFHHRCERKIRIRLNMLVDLPMILAKPWLAGFNEAIAKWRRDGGILIFHTRHHLRELPECDALFFIEAEFSQRKYGEIIQRVNREVVVYRPPNWELHDETVHAMYPTTETHNMIRAVANGFIGREWTPLQVACVEHANSNLRTGEKPYTPENTAVYEYADILPLIGIGERYLRRAFNLITLRWAARRYHPYTPLMAPEDDGLLWAYEKLCAEPAVYRNTRILRADTLSEGVIPKFEMMLKLLRKNHYVDRLKCVYLYNTTHGPIDDLAINAVANARRADWYAMRQDVDDAPEYPL